MRTRNRSDQRSSGWRVLFRTTLGGPRLCEDVIIDPTAAWAARDRIRAPVAGLPHHPLPMLSELLPEQMQEVRLALGALATMAAVAALFAAIGEVMSGNSMPGLPSPELLEDLLRDDQPMRDDPVLDRPAKWSGGLMVDLAHQRISRLAGHDAVGHVGGLANSAALYDPARRASVAVYLNGVGAEFDDQAVPRQQIMDRVLGAVPAQ